MPSEPITDMPSCEAIQIAHEMHAHGAAAELSATDVERHARTCVDCRGYVEQSRKIDDMSAFAIPESEFAHLRLEAIHRRLPRLRFELLLAIGSTLLAIAFCIATKTWGIALGAIFGLVLFWRKVDRRSRVLESAMVSTGRELLGTLREDAKQELAYAERMFLPNLVAGPLLLLIAFDSSLFEGVFFSVVLAVYWPGYFVWFRARKRELESLG